VRRQLPIPERQICLKGREKIVAKVLEFEDADEFYEELKELLEAEEEIVVNTDFTHQDEVPGKLKKIFKLNEVSERVVEANGLFAHGVRAPTSGINAKPLLVMSGAAAGATAGGVMGAGPGAVIGGVGGAVVGLLAAGTVEEDVEVVVEVDAKGKLRIHVTPKGA
jgi:hypothetical protein